MESHRDILKAKDLKVTRDFFMIKTAKNKIKILPLNKMFKT
jgi:hypothetical protein